MYALSRLEQIEEKIISNKILLAETKTKSVKACALKLNSQAAIFFDTSKFNTTSEEVLALTHEYYHVEYDVFYTFNDSLQTRKRREFKANYYTALELLPPSEFKLALKSMEPYEIAEKFNVTEDFIREAYRIYKAKGMI